MTNIIPTRHLRLGLGKCCPKIAGPVANLIIEPKIVHFWVYPFLIQLADLINSAHTTKRETLWSKRRKNVWSEKGEIVLKLIIIRQTIYTLYNMFSGAAGYGKHRVEQTVTRTILPSREIFIVGLTT